MKIIFFLFFLQRQLRGITASLTLPKDDSSVYFSGGQTLPKFSIFLFFFLLASSSSFFLLFYDDIERTFHTFSKYDRHAGLNPPETSRASEVSIER